jgi:hypothetical protein
LLRRFLQTATLFARLIRIDDGRSDVPLTSRQPLLIVYASSMSTQFITDAEGGKVAVIIPIAEYENLMEDIADLACVAERRDDERIPLEELKKRLVADGLLPS